MKCLHVYAHTSIFLIAEPKVQWMKGKEPIKQSKYFTMTSDGEVHCLKISEAFPEDEGNYYCIISNTIGKVSYTTLPLYQDTIILMNDWPPV